jgi:hypothetical protein
VPIPFLADGGEVPAALRDNVFAVAVPQASLPGEIVGYDASGWVAVIVRLQANKPCPPAEFPTPVSKLPPPEKWERIDLGSLTVGGEPILGKTPDEVQAILGTPALIRSRAQVTSGVNGVFEIPEFRYGRNDAFDARSLDRLRQARREDRCQHSLLPGPLACRCASWASASSLAD